jgi:hypothetical protein
MTSPVDFCSTWMAKKLTELGYEWVERGTARFPRQRAIPGRCSRFMKARPNNGDDMENGRIQRVVGARARRPFEGAALQDPA